MEFGSTITRFSAALQIVVSNKYLLKRGIIMLSFIKNNILKVILSFILVTLFFVNIEKQYLWIAFVIWLIIIFSPNTRLSNQNKK